MSNLGSYDFGRYLKGARLKGDWWLGLCPFHADTNPSFSGNRRTGAWKCFAGCGKGGWNAFAKRVGAESRVHSVTEHIREPTKSWEYRTPDGAPCLRVDRFDYVGMHGPAKTFRQKHWDGVGWRDGGVDPKLIAPYLWELWRDSPRVWLVEGEKCADALTELFIPATSFPGGANAWRDCFTRFFEGKHVTILPDHDLPGEKFALQAASCLHRSHISVSIMKIPPLRREPGFDVADLIAHLGPVKAKEILEACYPEPYLPMKTGW